MWGIQTPNTPPPGASEPPRPPPSGLHLGTASAEGNQGDDSTWAAAVGGRPRGPRGSGSKVGYGLGNHMGRVQGNQWTIDFGSRLIWRQTNLEDIQCVVIPPKVAVPEEGLEQPGPIPLPESGFGFLLKKIQTCPTKCSAKSKEPPIWLHASVHGLNLVGSL